MLIISRRAGEKILIRENGRVIVTISVEERRRPYGTELRLGFDAERRYEILRGELVGGK